VQRPAHGVEIDDAGCALEGVDRPKALSSRSLVVALFFQRQQVVRRLLDKLAAFDQELLDELVHGARPHQHGDVFDQ
jgi:hypothetical protein